MPEARCGSVPIDYSDTGRGEPALLYLPGWCSTREAFGKLPGMTAQKRRSLALDWRGHGKSGAPEADFGTQGLVDDAVAVIAASGAHHVIPVAQAHAGWVAIELRRRLKDRIPKVILVDWLVLDPPAPFASALRNLQDPLHWEESRNRLFSTWLEGVSNEEIIQFVRVQMGTCSAEMWARSGREIAAAYKKYFSPLRALEKLNPTLPVLHIYAQPSDPAYYQAHQSFADSHPWFSFHRVNAISHFPTLEVPEETYEAIEKFVTS
jgi:pimeloyl-ACP methyl ester carboxylesterase